MARLETQMKKTTNFPGCDWHSWPSPADLEQFVLAPKGQEWPYRGGNDNWGLAAVGLYGTDYLPASEQVTVNLSMTGNPDLGVTLFYRKWDGRIRRKQTYNSRGDLRRLGEFVRSLHGTPLSVGLFVPFPVAWKAVKEFIETDGELPTGIEWIANSDLPPETFPDP
jgi:hypothetical protein